MISPIISPVSKATVSESNASPSSGRSGPTGAKPTHRGRRLPKRLPRCRANSQRELSDLKQTRSGPAQEEKKAAEDALQRLRRTPNAERDLPFSKPRPSA